jgi:class 3 adenylate cyclase/Flp pilus assembly protein TadD
LPTDLGQSAMPHPAQPGHRLGPAEGLFDAFADALGDRVDGMAGGAAVDRRTASALILRDMRGHRFVAQFHDKVAGVVPLVGTERNRLRPVGVRFDQRQRRQPLGMARSAGGHCADDQTIAVFHQGVAHETQPRFFAGSFAEAENEIMGRLARTLNLELLEDVGRRIERERPGDLDAQDLIMRGRALFNRPYSAATLREALLAYEQALEKDPESIEAKIGIASVLLTKIASAWSTSAQDAVQAEQLLLEALELNSNNAWARAMMGLLRRLQDRLTESRIEWETAIALDPNNVTAVRQLGYTLMHLGDPEAAIPIIEKGIRLSRYDAGAPGAYQVLGLCHLLLGRVEQAIDFSRKSRAGNPRLYHTHTVVAAAFALNGNLDEAKAAALAEAIKLKPEISSLAGVRASFSYTNPEYVTLVEKTVFVGLPSRHAGRMTATRRLAAILAADMVGYSRLIGADEGATLQGFKAIRSELFDPTIVEHHGRLVKTTGDGMLVEFSFVVDAIRCATEVQAHMAERNATVPTDKRIEFRIGINVGDMLVEEDGIFGGGVNVAARLEGLAEPGGIWASARVGGCRWQARELVYKDNGGAYAGAFG